MTSRSKKGVMDVTFIPLFYLRGIIGKPDGDDGRGREPNLEPITVETQEKLVRVAAVLNHNNEGDTQQ